MERFVEPSAEKFTDRMVFVEKSLDHSRDLVQQYRIFGVPTFVLIDSKGEEIGRFGFESSAESFEEKVSRLLSG
jgi:thioredoxin-related protein